MKPLSECRILFVDDAKPNIGNTADDRRRIHGQLVSSTQIPVCLWFLAKNKNADAKRSLYDRRRLISAGIAKA